MDGELITLRILHIVAGVLWAGGAVYMVLLIEPALTASGPDVMKQVGPRIGKPVSIYMHAMGAITIIVGLVLVARLPGRSYSDLFTTGWGWAIGIGLIVSAIAFVLGSTGGQAMRKAAAISAQLKSPPTPEQVASIKKLQERYRTFNRTAGLLVIVAVGTMAAARYV